MASVDVEVKGLIELQRKMEQMVKDVHGEPILNAMRDSTLQLQRDARIFAPVDTGRLRASIIPTIRSTPASVEGVIGTNVEYAPYMEFGTRPHFPPIAALQVWADRHGVNVYYLAKLIGARGLEARKYMQKSFEKNKSAIERRFERAIAEIVNK